MTPEQREDADETSATGAGVDELIAGPHGAFPVRVYRLERPPVGGVVWVHGGAFYSGNLDMPEADQVCRHLAGDGFVVVSPDYRLAPVPPGWPSSQDPQRRGPGRYPAAVLEVAATFRWARAQWPDLPGWAIGGASAGANLAACAALQLRDGGDPVPVGLLLAYPTVHRVLPAAGVELQQRTADLPAERQFSPATVTAMNTNYLGQEVPVDPRAFAGGQDLTGLPRSLVLNSDRDDLRASGQAFTAELALAGVDVMQVKEPGTLHGHLNDAGSPAAVRSLQRMSAWLRGRDRPGRPTTPAGRLDQ